MRVATEDSYFVLVGSGSVHGKEDIRRNDVKIATYAHNIYVREAVWI